MRRMFKIWTTVAAVLISTILFNSVAFSDEQVVAGTIESSLEGIVLVRTDGERFVVFGEDLSQMVGKRVQVTGRVEEGPYGKSVWVTAFHQIVQGQ